MHKLNVTPPPMLVRASLALTWIAFACIAWISKDSFKPASDQYFPIALAIMACFGVPPFIAVGTLFGKARLGCMIGLACFSAFAAWTLYALSHATDL